VAGEELTHRESPFSINMKVDNKTKNGTIMSAYMCTLDTMWGESMQHMNS